ncbi:MAG: alpha/beta fold hydrolase [Pseudomonadota bacterium]
MSDPIVFLPGLMCDARLFGPQIEALSGQHTVSVGCLTQAQSIEEMARTVLDDAPAHFSLLGLSMGGIVAMEVVRIAPERVRRLALLDTNPKAEHPKVAEGREPQIAAALAGQLEAVMREEMKPNYLAEGPNRAQVLDLVMVMALDLGADVFERQSRALQKRPDQQETLKAVALPTLVLCGKEDALCPVHRHELMADLIPDAELVVLDGAGHLPTLETPEATNQALKYWMARPA